MESWIGERFVSSCNRAKLPLLPTRTTVNRINPRKYRSTVSDRRRPSVRIDNHLQICRCNRDFSYSLSEKLKLNTRLLTTVCSIWNNRVRTTNHNCTSNLPEWHSCSWSKQPTGNSNIIFLHGFDSRVNPSVERKTCLHWNFNCPLPASSDRDKNDLSAIRY